MVKKKAYLALSLILSFARRNMNARRGVVLCSLLFSLFSSSWAADLVLLSNYADAVCIDGTPGGFYYVPGEAGTHYLITSPFFVLSVQCFNTFFLYVYGIWHCWVYYVPEIHYL